MIEKNIYLDEIEPLDFFGVNNSRLEKIKTYFPKLRIVARGNELKVFGEAEQITNFEERLQVIIKHQIKYQKISEVDLEILMTDDVAKINDIREKNDDILVYGIGGRTIKAKTENQKNLVEAYKTNDLLFAIGPGGSGKTYMAIALAVRALRNKEVRKIILSRPAVEAGEKLGFLPGDLKEKLDPYLQALYDALNDMLPARKLDEMIADGLIQIAPLAYMRGRTLANCVVILDEAQNTSFNQMKMFLTRMGKNSKFIVTGDITQIDLPNKQDSGLLLSEKILTGIEGISFIKFGKQDIVRHRLVKLIVDAYERNPELEDYSYKPGRRS